MSVSVSVFMCYYVCVYVCVAKTCSFIMTLGIQDTILADAIYILPKA